MKSLKTSSIYKIINKINGKYYVGSTKNTKKRWRNHKWNLNHKCHHNDYLQKAFKIGYPIHCQYGLKPSLSYFYIPKFLVELSYIYENIKLGLECCELFLEKNKGNDEYYYTMQSWSKM